MASDRVPNPAQVAVCQPVTQDAHARALQEL
jgi:hypothetical protein